MALSIDRALSCPNLPTLPAVAMQVLELTRDPNVTVVRLAKLVQADPSLSAKVLRTVNSSFFGLPAPCSKIDRALAMLGLNTIKALVLGFTLVEGTKGVPGDKGLDLTRHWRRAVYAAAAARHVASTTNSCDPDEAFTAAMLQDIGMMACIVSFPEEYAAVLADFQLSHEHLPARELGLLGFDHAKVGAALARKWRLPENLARCIEHHHDPEQADAAVRPLAQAVWVGMVIAESMGEGAPGANQLRSLIEVARFFRCRPEELAPMLAKVAEGADTLAKAFDREVGSIPDIKEIMAVASEQILETQVSAIQQTCTLERQNQVLALKACTDPLTGACNRAALDTDGVVAFDKARAAATPFSVIFVDADRFKSINDTYGHAAGDAVLIEIVARVSADLPDGANLYRYGGEEFAVLAPGLDAVAGAALAERFRARIERGTVRIPRTESGLDATPVTISAGIATTAFAPGQPATLPDLIKLADQGVYKAKQEGRNRVCCMGSGTPPAETVRDEPGILLVEDDPFSARLVLAAVQKATGCIVTWVKRVDEAVKLLRAPRRFKLVLCDYDLGRRSALDVLSAVAGVLDAPPVHVITSDPDGDVKARCMAAGAARFSSKDDIAADLSKWCRELTDSLRAAA